MDLSQALIVGYVVGSIAGYILSLKFNLRKGADMAITMLVENKYIKTRIRPDGEIEFVPYTENTSHD